MKWIKLFEEFQMGDLNVMSPEEIQKLFIDECKKQTPDLELIKVILDNGLVDVNAKDNGGRSPLAVAVIFDNIALAELFISSGADVDSKDKYGYSPLYLAVIYDNVALAKLLISAGADVNAKDRRGWSPLYDARRVEVAELLISAGADVNTKDKDGWSPLAVAVGKDNVDLVEYLISVGADVNAKYYGISPLHWAADRDNIALAKLLISAGADVNAKDDDNDSPLDYAISRRYVEMEVLLKKNGAVL